MKSGQAYFVGIVVIVAAIIVYTTVNNSNKKATSESANNIVDTSPSPSAQNTNTPVANQGGEVAANIKGAPVLGDKSKTQVAIVEFSDYECPYCKRFEQDTYDQIVNNYINTGKAVLYFKNLPLSFHEPAATTDAMTVSCARDQKGDQTYFEFGKQVFLNTQGNGKGMTTDTLNSIISQFGLNKDEFNQCVSGKKFAGAIQADAADGGAVGISGTPSFVVGKIEGDSVKGTVLEGAQPFSAFSAALDKLQ